ncbi:MAG: 3-oxo-tetronate kinase [Geminicoccaceae bacterium]
MSILLGAIADDFTGATDLCSMLVRNGMRTVQLIGVPEPGLAVPEADAVVVALKSRTIAAGEAVAQSLTAQRWLAGQGARQYLFKYCSTFDSTDQGNIGPVADALLEILGSDFTIACPAFPETGRTIFKGHLFVGDLLLSDTHMRHHPLTPMTDSNLVRVLQRQTGRKVGLVSFDVVRQGPEAIRQRFEALRADGCSYAITDAIEDEDLRRLGAACAGLPLLTGGSGIAMGLPANFRGAGQLRDGGTADALPEITGGEVVLAGSCSAATLEQVAVMAESRPALKIDAVRLAEGWDPAEATEWAVRRMVDGPVLVYASATPAEVQAAQERLGRDRAGGLVEDALAAIAGGVVEAGARRLVVAGGETSGAVVQALGVKGLAIGAMIDPGVPATVSIGRDPPLALALKSGNFGGRDFFLRALRCLPGGAA